MLLHHWPEIISYDGIHMLLLSNLILSFNQRFICRHNFTSLNHLSVQFLHMGAESFEFVIQIGVDIIYLPIEIHSKLLLTLKNLINYSLNVAFLSWCRILVKEVP